MLTKHNKIAPQFGIWRINTNPPPSGGNKEIKMKIVAETKNGSQSPHNVFTVADDFDYINRIIASHPRSDGVHDIQTLDDAMAFENECHAQQTQIIDQAEYESTEGWPSKIDTAAENLGWLPAATI